jgi:phosphotransferase family enzyme
MTAPLSLPLDAPRGLRDEVERRDATVQRVVQEARRSYVWLECAAGALFARYSADPVDVPVFEHEAETRSLIGTRGPLRAPAVLARGEGWLLEDRIEPRPVAGTAALGLVLEAAAAIARLSLPPAPELPEETWPARLMRRLRLLRLPSLLPHLVRARRLARETELPEVTSHGDFHPANLLLTDSSVYVVDWEMTGLRPAGSDLLQLWASLRSPEDRAQVFAGALDLVGTEHRSALERLRYVLLVQTIGVKMSTALPASRDPAGARRLLSLLPEAREAVRDPHG